MPGWRQTIVLVTQSCSVGHFNNDNIDNDNIGSILPLKRGSCSCLGDS